MNARVLIGASGTFLSHAPLRDLRPVQMIRLTLIAAFVLGARIADAQPPRLKPVPPMDIPLLLSGNFMELRTGHFHSGLDMKTNGVEGVPVKAVKDGFVARVKLSPWGYGKAIYLQHADGTTTVYGHLSGFAPGIASAVLNMQYAAKDQSIDQAPPSRIEVKQGETIAFSGNTGGSTAPHLHFEVRRTSDQHALDPEAHGIDLKDDIAPDILGVRFYALDSGSRVAPYPGKARGFATRKNGTGYSLDPEAIVAAQGTIGLAVHTIDRYNGSENKCGVRHIELLVDSVPYFSVELDEIDFELTRYCDAHMDFEQYKDADLHYHRLYKLPNNPLAIYGKEAAAGRIHLKPGDRRTVRIAITDANGNRSTIAFILHGASAEQVNAWPAPVNDGILFKHDRENRFARDDLRLVIPPASLYDDLRFNYDRKKGSNGIRSALHRLHDPYTPMRLNAELSIRADSVPAALGLKALIVRYDGPGKLNAVGGSWSADWVTARVRAFGTYCIMVDTVAPKVTPIDLKGTMTGRKGFALRVADNLSGVDSWTATLDGEWILMEYDPKSKTLTHTFDTHSEGSGRRELKVVVNDERKNTTVFTYTFTR